MITKIVRRSGVGPSGCRSSSGRGQNLPRSASSTVDREYPSKIDVPVYLKIFRGRGCEDAYPLIRNIYEKERGKGIYIDRGGRATDVASSGVDIEAFTAPGVTIRPVRVIDIAYLWFVWRGMQNLVIVYGLQYPSQIAQVPIQPLSERCNSDPAYGRGIRVPVHRLPDGLKSRSIPDSSQETSAIE